MKRHNKCNRRPVRLRERRLAGEGIDLCIDINVSDIARYKTLHLCISPVVISGNAYLSVSPNAPVNDYRQPSGNASQFVPLCNLNQYGSVPVVTAGAHPAADQTNVPAPALSSASSPMTSQATSSPSTPTTPSALSPATSSPFNSTTSPSAFSPANLASFPTSPDTSSTATASFTDTAIPPAPVTLVEWLERYEQEDSGFRPSTLKGRSDMRKKVQQFLRQKRNPQIAINEVDSAFCQSFLRFLTSAKNSVCTVNERVIKQGCAHHHQAVFNGALNRAVRLGLLPANPMKSLDRREKIQPSTEEREYLTIDELRTLMATPCTSDQIKKAFVFSCFTGLRLSDVRTLSWKMVRKSPDGSSLSAHVVMRKTRKPNIIPLSQEALNCLQPKADPDEPIFVLPAGYATVNYHIKKWVRAAGIDKTISYHCSRHTFATMMLTLGADVYTTSKLLGHTDVATTAIYAKIVDKKKVETVNLVGNIFRVGSGQEKVDAETV